MDKLCAFFPPSKGQLSQRPPEGDEWGQAGGEGGEGDGGDEVGQEEGGARVDALPGLLVVSGPLASNWINNIHKVQV